MAAMVKNKFTILLNEMLLPARKKLHGVSIHQAMAKAFNQMIFVAPGSALIWLLCSPFIPESNSKIHFGIIFIIALSVFWIVIMTMKSLMCQPSWNAVAKHIDDETNIHNAVSIAYEHGNSESPSLFAKISIKHGIEMIDKYADKITKPKSAEIFMGRIVAGFAIAAILYAASYWVSKSSVRNEAEKIAAGEKAQTAAAIANEISNKSIQNSNKKTDTAKNLIEKHSFSQTIESQMQKSLPLSDMSGKKSFGNDNSGQQTGKSSQTQSGSAASAQDTNKQNKTPDSAQKLRKDNKSGSFTTEAKNQENSSNTSSKGMAGSSPNAESDIKASLVSGGLGETPDNDEADQNHDESPSNSLSTLGQRPELSDKQTAPNRDLGMTGKPGDKAGDGRGGPGLVKKSRATASSLSAMTIPVYIKGQIQPGKSKSYSQLLPLTSGEYQLPAFNAENDKAVENQNSVYTPDAEWKSIIQAYFLNLRKSESK
jgi:hypothetical protein